MTIKKIITIFLLVIAASISSQAQVFKAGIVGGLNFAQIDGDNIGGYAQWGVNAGFISQIDISQRWKVDVEILFDQRGSRVVVTQNNPVPFRIATDYASIPILVKFHDLKGGMNFGAGLSYGRLVRTRYVFNGEDLTDDYFTGGDRNFDMGILADLSYMFNEVWGLNLRIQYSLFPFRFDQNSNFARNGQYHNVVSLRTIFLFSAINRDK